MPQASSALFNPPSNSRIEFAPAQHEASYRLNECFDRVLKSNSLLQCEMPHDVSCGSDSVILSPSKSFPLSPQADMPMGAPTLRARARDPPPPVDRRHGARPPRGNADLGDERAAMSCLRRPSRCRMERSRLWRRTIKRGNGVRGSSVEGENDILEFALLALVEVLS
jgi:hypothetical protein